MNRLLTLALLLLFILPGYGQKMLQLEKAGSLKSTRFFVGDEMTFRLKNDDKGWYTRIIHDFDLNNNWIVFHQYTLPLDSIEMIQLDRNHAMQIVGGALQGGGINMVLFSTYYSIFQDRDLDWSTIISGVANVGIGTAIRKLFRKKRFKPGKHKRLRLLDVSFGPPQNKS